VVDEYAEQAPQLDASDLISEQPGIGVQSPAAVLALSTTPTPNPNPPHTLGRFTGARDTIRGMLNAIQGPRGEQSMLVRGVTERVVGDVFPKDYAGEILAICYWVASHVLYLNDPMHVELLKDPQRMMEEILGNRDSRTRGDCDDIATLIATMALQCGRESQLVVAGFKNKGQYSHVFVRVFDPKGNDYIVCDPVAGSKVRKMLRNITTYQVWSCDEPFNRGPIISR
jgi:hypothetical protein